jgi:hypothetical protein
MYPKSMISRPFYVLTVVKFPLFGSQERSSHRDTGSGVLRCDEPISVKCNCYEIQTPHLLPKYLFAHHSGTTELPVSI